MPIIPIDHAHHSCRVNSRVCDKWLEIFRLIIKCEETKLYLHQQISSEHPILVLVVVAHLLFSIACNALVC